MTRVELNDLLKQHQDNLDDKAIIKQIEEADTSKVTNMSHLFEDMIDFNVDISKWNVSSVTSMDNMLNGAILFNQPLDNWNVTKYR